MYQQIDWWHSALDEKGDHAGNLSSELLEINSTYGLTDNWNLSVDIMTGVRSMDFHREANIHHRDEDKAGIGDTRIILRYLMENTTFGPGQRIFAGAGIGIPSGNSVTKNPFQLGIEGKEHTHFDLSEGVYKGLVEIQYFNRTIASIFPGGIIKADFPLETNSYGFKPGNSIHGALLAYIQTKSLWGGMPYFSLLGQYRTPDFWDGTEAPNSGGSVVQTGGGLSWNWNGMLITGSFRAPVYYATTSVSQEQDKLENKTDVWELSLSIRKLFSLNKMKSDKKKVPKKHDHSHP